MVVKEKLKGEVQWLSCGTALFQMVVKGNLIQTIYLLCCTSVCFHMVVKDVIKSCSNESWSVLIRQLLVGLNDKFNI